MRDLVETAAAIRIGVGAVVESTICASRLARPSRLERRHRLLMVGGIAAIGCALRGWHNKAAWGRGGLAVLIRAVRE
jgi:hypothetical protein